MTQRMQLDKVMPEGFDAVYALERYVQGRVDHDLLELVKLRASIDNGCAFCLDMHATDALRAGEDVRRVIALAAWRESPFFNPKERVALELTDAVTAIGEGGVPDGLWAEAVQVFGDEGLANLVLAIATINVWNRLLVTTRTPPPPLAG